MSRVQTNNAAHAAKPMGLGGAVTPMTIGDAGAYSPAYLQSAYNLPSATNGAGETVAIVDANDDPNAESDLAAYRTHYGLSPCTTANGCFRKVDEDGGTSYPAPDGGWALEISLDLDMVSAICPNCHILLVEATTSSFSDMGVAENEAVTLGADVVSNSFDGGEFSSELTSDADFNHPGVPITVASGDSGYGTEYPAGSPGVTAVGGTSLHQATNTGTRNATETAWSGAGSGCSNYEPKPSWQTDACPMRTVADVSAVADPSTPVWAYDTYPDNGATYTWAEVGGTSVAAPIVAGVYALAGQPLASSLTPAEDPYAASTGALNDVTSGSNGGCGTYLCTAGIGYDGPTGLGTPNGVGAFQPSRPSEPQDLTDDSFNGTAVLSWSAPALDGGARVATYNVYRADRGGSPIASVSAPTNTYVDSGLVNGSAYTYTVTAVNLVGEGPGASASAIPEALDHITVSPANSTISAGGAQTYDAQGFDASGNLIGDLTAATSFAIGPNGTCTVDTCTTTVAGDHVVTANLAGTTATAALHVAPGFLDHMALSPATANVTAGGSTSYAAAGFDRFGNSLGDTTAGTTFSIIPDGSCAGATCLATDAGDHLVTGAATGTLTNTEVSARGFDACAVAADGTVKCWGDNSSGQLGNGTTTDSAIPVAVSNLPSAVASVSVGGSRSACALTAAGAVYCWGLNFYGQLGNGVSGFDSSGVYSMTPVAVSGLTTGVASISVGGGQACALTTAGSVYCWGWNGYGQLGNGTTTSSSVPVAVTGLTSGVQAISAGGVDTCAITAAGAVYCWGYGYSPVPEAISGLTSGVTSISAGQLYACAMTAGGALYCWGDNSEGQLGNGTTTSSSVPVAVSGLTAGVITVSAGMGASTCAVTTAGAVYCWGDDQLGQLGNGISSWGPNGYGSDVYSTTPVAVSGLTSGAAKVSAGSAFTCTLTTAGAVECWGYNGLGQLGVGLGGNQAFSLVPVDTRTATIATAALSACCGPLDHLALAPTNATILVGGSQTYSAQGYNNVNNSMGGMTGGATFSIAPDGSCVGATCTAAAIGPHTVKGTITSTSMSAGFMHTCAVSAIGGVTCWGWNAYGQLGDGTTTSSSTPGPVSGRFSDVVAISAGYRDTCAITAEGALYCWGDNSLGQLGDGTTMNSLVPVPVTGLASGVTAVSTGYDYSCAITTAGAVKCWGSSTMVPFTIPGLTSGVTAVSVGTDHICVIRFGGALCWGNNFYGGLGNGTTTAAFAPVAVSGLTSGVIAISAADASSCAVTTGGRLYCWGYNTSGQLGNGTATDSRVPVAVSGMTSGVTAVSVSSSGSTCAVATRGAVYCWGLNASGQLGNGTYANTSVPVPVTGLPNGATSVSLGGSDACALISRGAVYCWGYNGLGQLGGGAVASSAIPIDSGATTTATATLDVAHTFEGLPVISAVTPSAGPLTGGQLVTVTGSGFVAGMTATIGGTTVTPSGVTANSFTFTTPAESAGYDQVQVTTPAGVSALTLAAGYIYTGLGSFVPMTPFRILDTRSGLCGVHRCGALGAGQTLSLQVTGYTDARTTESVPANATAVVLNVLAVNGSSASLLTVYPNGTGRPLASNLNFPAHENVANLVTVALGQNGTSDTQREVNLYNALGTLNVVADVEGYFVAQAASNPAGEFHAIAPLRVCDTRAKQPANDCNQGHSTDNTIGPGQVLKVNVSGVPSGVGGSAASIPTDGTAGAAVLNLTAVAGTQATWLSAFPTQPNGTCLTSVPGSSTINVSAGGAEANRVMARLGPSHSGGPNTDVCVYNAAGTINVVLDASGWFGSATGSPPSGAQYQAIGPTRICDTRSGTGTLCSGHQLTSGGTQLVRVAGVGGIPGSGAVAIIANLTAVNGSQPTYLTVYPADVRSKPNASDLNLNPGIALPNLVVVGLASGAHPGDVNLFNAMGSINAVLDVDGWFQ